ncbi:MAG: hypothetical protein H7Z42_14070 [Roseiflexaceae bacterium]|nr:hypothetical protein [Roseiflexaceae bacterium]
MQIAGVAQQRRRAEALGYRYEARLRGLTTLVESAQAGFVMRASGSSRQARQAVARRLATAPT